MGHLVVNANVIMNVKTTPINSNTILNHCFYDIQINTTFVPGILQEPNQINSVLAENVAAVVSKNKNILVMKI